MRILYKDYERHSFKIHESGYLLPLNDDSVEVSKVHYSNEVLDYYVKPEDNDHYFFEADIVSKINENEEGYFDFNKRIVDIGAHAGVYSFRTPFSYAYAFEPNKLIYNFLNINLIMHDMFDKFETYNVLLSDKEEDIFFDGFQHTDDSTKECIKSKTLDSFNINDVGLIKIDVEGMEEKVLRGAIGTIFRNSYPPILFELWDVGYMGMTQERHDSLRMLLESMGYDILWYWGNFETHLAIHKT